MIRDTSGQDRPLAKPVVPRMWRRWLPRALIAMVAVAAIGYLLGNSLGASRTVERARLRIAQVTRGTLVRDVVADGRVVAANSPTLYAVAAGTVDFRARPGDNMKREQVIATIVSPELQSKLVQEQATQAVLTSGVDRATLDVQRGDTTASKLIAQAEVDRQAAAREVELNKEMFARGIVPEIEFRRTEDSLKKAEIALRYARVEAELHRKELAFELTTRKQSADRQRAVVAELERQVAALTITSPVDGQVGQWLVAQSANVAANTPIVTVVDLGAYELEIRAPESFARDFAIGMAAEIRSGTERFPARVRSVSPEVVDGNVATRLEFAGQRPAGLRQNQRLTARILLEERPDVLKVERGPFLEAGGANSAYFVEDGVAQRRPIRIGAIALDAVEIVSGAKAGDYIVVTGVDVFGSAESVRIAD